MTLAFASRAERARPARIRPAGDRRSHGCDGVSYATSWVMTTLTSYELHDHAGLRWLAIFGAAFVVTILTAFLMLLYPHMGM